MEKVLNLIMNGKSKIKIGNGPYILILPISFYTQIILIFAFN